jgi:predicted nucleotidyltransferase
MTLPYTFIDRLKALPFVEAIYLYGSRARGDHRPKSDIDLAIVCPTADIRQWQQVLDIIDAADTLLEIGCVRLDEQPADSELRQRIERDKVLIFERPPLATPVANPLIGDFDTAMATVVTWLQIEIPSLSAVYVFGSRAVGNTAPQSDLDLAILADCPPDAVSSWTLAGGLADVVGCDVDLLDFRAASTVMQHQIITTGRRLWARDAQAALYESFILSEKTALDEARAGWLDDIAKDGRIYGR